jgi:hypothetical protein
LAVSNTAAETPVGACQIVLAPVTWTAYALHQGDPPFPAVPVNAATGRYTLCAILTHEYGHSLGLADVNDNTMMNADPTVRGREQPLCAAVYTPKHLTRYDRRWLASYGR